MLSYLRTVDRMIKRIGILTGGGDAAGLNAVIRAVVLTAHYHYDWQVIGIRQGFDSLLLDETPTLSLTPDSVRGILARGGDDPRRGQPR